MYTSDKNEIIHYADSMVHDAFLFLASGIVCAVFSLIYELFSHEVYSFYMIYAFLIPLVPGALLNLMIVWHAVRKEKHLRIKEAAAQDAVNVTLEESDTRYELSKATETNAVAGVFFPERADSQICAGNDISETTAAMGVFFPGRFTRHAWNSGLAALTAGSLFKGVLEIYGTTNKLIVVYPITAAVLLCTAVFSFLMSYVTIRRMCRKAEMTAA